jgi:hypothetical protein
MVLVDHTALAEELDGIRGVLAGCHEFLRLTYREEDGLFPYSTRQGDWVSDYDHPQTIRYTINTLLGLQASIGTTSASLSKDDLDTMIRRFLDCHFARLDNPADIGLLLVLLSHAQIDRRWIETGISRARPRLSSGSRNLNMQDLAWLIWGACAADRHGVRNAAALAHEAFAILSADFVHSHSGLPRHNTRSYRRHVVSFGSLVYFLRAMHEYGSHFSDSTAMALFQAGVQKAIRIQGPSGEWPWMIDISRGTATDFYPVFSVHQDSMAHLFLLPALDLGLESVRNAIIQSWRWVLGANELGVGMFETAPFFAYRSIERAEPFPRLRRYLRATTGSLPRAAPAVMPGSGANVRINTECRSYHLGWILYVWSHVDQAAESPA